MHKGPGKEPEDFFSVADAVRNLKRRLIGMEMDFLTVLDEHKQGKGEFAQTDEPAVPAPYDQDASIEGGPHPDTAQLITTLFTTDVEHLDHMLEHWVAFEHAGSIEDGLALLREMVEPLLVSLYRAAKEKGLME
jgi:hypothetical protein